MAVYQTISVEGGIKKYYTQHCSL